MKAKRVLLFLMISGMVAAPAAFAQGDGERESERGGESGDREVHQSDAPVEFSATLQVDQQSESDSQTEMAAFADQIIPLDKAVSIAMKRAGAGIELLSVSLDVEDGYVVYSAEYTDSSRVILDAANGDIVYTGRVSEEGGEEEG